MKNDDSDREIGDLLRSRKPSAEPSPFLEDRILLALERHRRPAPRRRWPWLLVPPAFAALALLLSRPPAPRQEISRTTPLAPVEPAIRLADFTNPLEQETLALNRDARRAGDFLLDCLPSLGRVSE